jgi:hypothetical protein
MNSRDARNLDTNSKGRHAALVVGATVIAAILLSGLLLTGAHQLAIAQQNVTSGATISADEATTENATITTTIGGGNVTTNMTTAGGEENQSSKSQVRMILEQVLTALQNRDTQSAIRYLDIAINGTRESDFSNASAGSSSTQDNTSLVGSNAITSSSSQEGGGETSARDNGISALDHNTVRSQVENHETITPDNNDAANVNNEDNNINTNTNTVVNSPTTNTGQSDEGTSECGGVSVGGTSAADDYGCNDPDAE